MYRPSILLAAAAVLTSAQASPFHDIVGRSSNALTVRDLESTSCVNFVVGANSIPLGQVCVTIAAGIVTIKYPTLTGGKVYSDLHAIIKATAITETVAGQWPLTKANTKCTTTSGGADGTCTIAVDDAWRVCGKTLYLGAHATFGLPGTSGDGGWGSVGGSCIVAGARGNCPKAFSLITECKCPFVTTYAPYSTQIEYVVTKTIYETSTTTCTAEKAPETATSTCAVAFLATQTVDGGVATPAGFTCSTPEPAPPPACT
ncbi:hypothetical protein P154DRAFT_599205 [Amniculicola lignicola CBS 123094]|uniref:Uncharacterized protein n=1 Tax=Amniculicola lignicola CBS 123094 TaxID=1392246 RepID=A0A6A5WGQ0_9PLEO|nr:hypothetical protein P154DRAFT_599205 [Amniculicola lignicola CBS 123094]